MAGKINKKKRKGLHSFPFWESRKFRSAPQMFTGHGSPRCLRRPPACCRRVPAFELRGQREGAGPRGQVAKGSDSILMSSEIDRRVPASAGQRGDKVHLSPRADIRAPQQPDRRPMPTWSRLCRRGFGVSSPLSSAGRLLTFKNMQMHSYSKMTLHPSSKGFIKGKKKGYKEALICTRGLIVVSTGSKDL